jgi:hypothetical protein
MGEEKLYAATTPDNLCDIAEVRAVTGATTCNQLLADGWVLLGVYPLTTVAEMTAGEEQRTQDIQRYMRRMLGYIVGEGTRIVSVRDSSELRRLTKFSLKVHVCLTL